MTVEELKKVTKNVELRYLNSKGMFDIAKDDDIVVDIFPDTVMKYDDKNGYKYKEIILVVAFKRRKYGG